MNQTTMKCHKKAIVLIVIIILLLSIAILYFGITQYNPNRNIANLKIDGVVLPEGKKVAEFHFTDQNGNAFSQEQLKGHWSMMFFGFTNCGYVCPTTMAEMNKMYKTLQTELAADQLPQVILVTVDPERDTTEKMKSYINTFNPHFIGLRTDLTATEAFENEMNIAAIKMQSSDNQKDEYSVNHSSEILLINPEGKVQAYFNFPHKADALTSEYKLILKTLG